MATTQGNASCRGADKFLKYLEEELIPAIEAKYHTQPYRVIIGHSLGGLLAMYAFSAKPYLFQAYISLEGRHGGIMGL